MENAQCSGNGTLDTAGRGELQDCNLENCPTPSVTNVGGILFYCSVQCLNNERSRLVAMDVDRQKVFEVLVSAVFSIMLKKII